jgi:hypothetical protein
MAKSKSNRKRAASSAHARRLHSRVKTLTRRPAPKTAKGVSTRVCELTSIIQRLNAIRSKFASAQL